MSTRPTCPASAAGSTSTGIDGSVSVVIHHSGRRDVYVREARRGGPAVLALTDGQARPVGAILSGAYFKPAVVEEMEAVIGDLLIDWVTLREDSPAAGKSIAELEIRRRNPHDRRRRIPTGGDDHRSRTRRRPAAGDRLVVIGRREDLPVFVRDVVGGG